MKYVVLFVILFVVAIIVGAFIGYVIFRIGEKKSDTEIKKINEEIARRMRKKY